MLEAGQAEVEPVETIDATRRFARVRGDGGEPLPGDTSAALDRIVTGHSAAELTGVAQRAMEMAVEYARDRKQFGRADRRLPGGGAPLRRRCCSRPRAPARRPITPAWTADAEPESLPQAASMAKAYASDAGWRVTASALQVHGGIGFTWEHDLHFFLKRAKADGILFGSAGSHRERVAELSAARGRARPRLTAACSR